MAFLKKYRDRQMVAESLQQEAPKPKPAKPSAKPHKAPDPVSKEQLLEQHKKELSKYIEQELTINPAVLAAEGSELELIKRELLPSKRKKSFVMLCNILEYLYKHRIATTEEITRDLGISMPPLLTKLKIARKRGLVQRLARMYYLANPRLDYFVENDLPYWKKEVLG